VEEPANLSSNDEWASPPANPLESDDNQDAFGNPIFMGRSTSSPPPAPLPPTPLSTDAFGHPLIGAATSQQVDQLKTNREGISETRKLMIRHLEGKAAKEAQAPSISPPESRPTPRPPSTTDYDWRKAAGMTRNIIGDAKEVERRQQARQQQPPESPPPPPERRDTFFKRLSTKKRK